MAVEVASPLSRAASDSNDSPDTVMTGISDTELSESGSETKAPTSAPAPALSRNDDVDFLLHPAELAKGRRAAPSAAPRGPAELAPAVPRAVRGRSAGGPKGGLRRGF